MPFHSTLTANNLHIARSNAGPGSPIGAVTPGILGEFYYDTLGGTLFVATGLTNVDWAAQSGSTFPFGAISGPTGFPVDPVTGLPDVGASSLSFNDGTREFTISPTGAGFSFYQGGGLFTSTGDTIAITNATGMHYIYYDLGTLTETTVWSSDLYYTKVMVATVYWDDTSLEAIHLGDERHGCKMDGHTHATLHDAIGTQYLSGMDPLDILTDQDGSLNSHFQFGVDDGTLRDEDLVSSPISVGSLTGFPVYYRSGASGTWKRYVNAGYQWMPTGGGPTPGWNYWNGATWVVDPSMDTDFVCAHLFATNDVVNPFVVLMGTSEYISLSEAESGAAVEISQFREIELPFSEAAPIFSVIVEINWTYTNNLKARIRELSNGTGYLDWRQTISGASGVSDHSALTSLAYNVSGHSGFQKETLVSSSDDPEANNDSVDTAGIGVAFRQGDLWLNAAGTSQELFYATDVTPGAATWKRLNIRDELNYDGFPLFMPGASYWGDGPTVYSATALGKDIIQNFTTHYRYSFWDITEIDASGVVIGFWRKKRFLTFIQLFNFLRAHCQNDGFTFTNMALARVYDIVDTDITPIYKIYGQNVFYSMLRGAKKYLSMNVYYCRNDLCAWPFRSAWFEDLCNENIGFNPGGSFSPTGLAGVWFARSHTKSLYRLPKDGFTSQMNNNMGRQCFNFGASDFQQASGGIWSNTGSGMFSSKLWCYLNLQTVSSWYFTDSYRSAHNFSYYNNLSGIILYRMYLNDGGDDCSAVLVKPMGIDRAGINYYDSGTYYLYAYYPRLYHTQSIRRISTDVFNEGYHSAVKNNVYVEKMAWFPPLSAMSSLANSYNGSKGRSLPAEPDVHFFLKNKTTGLISPISKPYLSPTRNLVNSSLIWDVVH